MTSSIKSCRRERERKRERERERERERVSRPNLSIITHKRSVKAKPAARVRYAIFTEGCWRQADRLTDRLIDWQRKTDMQRCYSLSFWLKTREFVKTKRMKWGRRNRKNFFVSCWSEMKGLVLISNLRVWWEEWQVIKLRGRGKKETPNLKTSNTLRGSMCKC